uniref:DDE Tnp4 domain-containing protein n=1 Tax=Brassica oleracea var. oleracea TaxID=109376 RepID=A0A0D3EF51_BRAOL
MTDRSPSVKSAKANGKKRKAEERLSEFEGMWSIKKEDLAIKERLSKMKLLDSLIAKALSREVKESSIVTGSEGVERRKKRVYIERNCEEGDLRLWNDYFCETPTYPQNLFRRRFRMNKPLFMHIVDRLSNEVYFFRQKKDSLGRLSISALQKCSAAIRLLAYGTAADTVDEYLRLGETTARSCLENFVEGIIYLFGDEYLRRPTPADLQHLLDIGEHRGFSGMIGSIDCMHWEWKNCLTAWKEQYSRGSAVRKDVERAFGVLQARFAIVKNPTFFWDKVKIGKIMRASIILHNMIVEDERDVYTQFDVSEFQQGEDTGSSHVDLMYSTDIPTNIVNMMGVRTRIHDRQMHQQLKADLVEHIWRKFGHDEDNN